MPVIQISHGPVKSVQARVMKMKILSYGLLILIPLALTEVVYGCDLDQKERERYNMQIQKKYPGSTYVKKSKTILIPKGEDEISLSIGGCVNYGVAIELKTKMTNEYNDEAKLASKVYELSKEYSQGIIEAGRVKKVIAGKKWANINPDIEGYYVLNYSKNSTFEFYRRSEKGSTYVGVYYYR